MFLATDLRQTITFFVLHAPAIDFFVRGKQRQREEASTHKSAKTDGG